MPAVAASVLAYGVAPANAALAHPNVCQSDPSHYVYDNVVDKGLLLDGKGQPTIFQNLSPDTQTFTKSQTSSGTVTWAASASAEGGGGWNFAVVSASVKATVGGSYASATEDSQTVTSSVSVRSHWYGILQGGVFRRVTTGRYYFAYSNCTTGTIWYLTTKLPITAQGYAVTANTTGKVPWDQQ